jgi:hypothetical protein
MGDSSVYVISNIQLVTNAPAQAGEVSTYTTNFNFNNLDPQTGHGYPRPVGAWDRYFVMANGAPLHPPDTDPLAHRGQVYLLAGGRVEMIGQKVNDTYTSVVVPSGPGDPENFYPTLSPATIFGKRVMLLNGRFRDPWGKLRSMLLMWHGAVKQRQYWSIATQQTNGEPIALTNIAPYEQDSVITPYGTDGTTLWQLFAAPDPDLHKHLATKAFRGGQAGPSQLAIKNFKRLYLELHDKSGGGASLHGVVETREGGIPAGVQDVAFDIVPGRIFAIEPQALAAAGITAALDLHSISPDFIIERIHVGSEERTLYGA